MSTHIVNFTLRLNDQNFAALLDLISPQVTLDCTRAERYLKRRGTISRVNMMRYGHFTAAEVDALLSFAKSHIDVTYDKRIPIYTWKEK